MASRNQTLGPLKLPPEATPLGPPKYPPLTVEARALGCVRGGRLVFSGLSFKLGAGQLMAVTGPNGSGKSSFLRILAGLLPPASGKFLISAGQGGEVAAAHYLGHADALKPALTLREILGFWAALYGGREVAAAAERVGLAHALDLPVGVLSAGQRRRAGLARLLVSHRPLWLLDEPASALDRDGEALLGALLRDQLARGGVVIAATHAELPADVHSKLDLGAAA